MVLVGLVSVVRRFMNTEFPAAIKQVNDRLDTLHRDMDDIRRELQTTSRRVERHDEKLDTLRERVVRLESQEREPRDHDPLERTRG